MAPSIGASKTVYAAAGCSSSSKATPHMNEDCFDIARLPINSNISPISNGPNNNIINDINNALYVGVFDGHGGTNASSFASENLKHTFLGLDDVEKMDIMDRMEASFEALDRKLFFKVQQSRKEVELSHGITKTEVCKCKFFLENPCRCMNTPMHAREGSTATFLLLLEQDLYVANIGDSEAVAFGFNHIIHNHERNASLVLDEKELSDSEISDDDSNENDAAQKVLITAGSRNFTNLTTVDTPKIDQNDADYRRISSIASKRRPLYMKEGIRLDDGIKRGQSERLNYVRFPGAHSLNMTRAFGNFGHKQFLFDSEASENIKLRLDIENSPIVSTPHVSKYDLKSYAGNYFLVVGSDGLWDNLEKQAIFSLAIDYCRKMLPKIKRKIDTLERFKENAEEINTEILLAVLAEGTAKLLVEHAVKMKKKLDDITVVVVLFKSILNLIS